MEDEEYDGILSYLKWQKFPDSVKSRNRGNFKKRMEQYKLHSKMKSSAAVIRILVKVRNGKGDTTDSWRYLPRRSELKDLLQKYHIVLSQNGVPNHVGRDKMLRTIFKKYWWPKSARDDIQKYIKCCEEYSRTTPSFFKPPLQPIIAKHKREHCQFNLMEFPQDPDTGDRWLLNIINCLQSLDGVSH